jgi:hypothetical protein
MAFGLLKTKWRIFHTALELPLAESPTLSIVVHKSHHLDLCVILFVFFFCDAL